MIEIFHDLTAHPMFGKLLGLLFILLLVRFAQMLATNNIVLREQVLNYSWDFPYLWDEIVVPARDQGQTIQYHPGRI